MRADEENYSHQAILKSEKDLQSKLNSHQKFMLRQKLGITSLEDKFDENDKEEHREQDNDEDQQSKCNSGSETEKHGRLLRFMIYTLYVRDLGILISSSPGLKDFEQKTIFNLALRCAVLAVVGVLLILSHKHESR